MPNVALENMRQGKLSVGVGIRTLRSAETARILHTAGFDWMFIDCEHNALSIETASELSVGALDVGIAPLVRVPQDQYWMATRAMDGGAQGVIMPHVDTVEQARETVKHLRYPPVGSRSIGSLQAHINFRPMPVGELAAQLNRELLLCVMLETEQAIANCEEICAVDGIDVVMIGGNDLCFDMGIPGQLVNPRVVKHFQRVADACRKYGRVGGIGGVGRLEDFKLYVDMGFRFLLSQSDVGLLITAGQARTEALRKLV